MLIRLLVLISISAPLGRSWSANFSSSSKQTSNGPTAKFNISASAPQAYSSASVRCGSQYNPWYSAESSSADAFRTILSGTGGQEVQTIPKFFQSRPPCCHEVWGSWRDIKSPLAGSASEYSASFEKFRFPWLFATVPTVQTEQNDAYDSCMAKLYSTSTWIGADDQLHGQVIRLSGSCSASITTNYYLSATETLWDPATIAFTILNDFVNYGDPCVAKGEQCKCTIYDDGVQILFWPIAVTYSAGTRITISSAATGRATANYYGTVLTSSTIYLHYKSLWTGGQWWVGGAGKRPTEAPSRDIFMYSSPACGFPTGNRGLTDTIIPVPLNIPSILSTTEDLKLLSSR